MTTEVLLLLFNKKIYLKIYNSFLVKTIIYNITVFIFLLWSKMTYTYTCETFHSNVRTVKCQVYNLVCTIIYRIVENRKQTETLSYHRCRLAVVPRLFRMTNQCLIIQTNTFRRLYLYSLIPEEVVTDEHSEGFRYSACHFTQHDSSLTSYEC